MHPNVPWHELQICTLACSHLPLPPGPSGLPLIGNVLDIPLEDMESYLRDLNVKYGDITSLKIFGTPMIVLGTHEAAVELLEKRSSIYSDRNMTPTAELAGFDWLIAMMRYGPRWRKLRAVFHQCMKPNAIVQYRPIQESEIKKYLLRLVEDPAKFYEHGRHLIGAMIIRVAYGLEVVGENDKYIKIAEDAMDCFNIVFQPGRYLVQTFPSLRHIPAWFPGAGFRREFAAWFPTVRKIHEVPWGAAMAARREGHMPPSIVTTLMDRAEERGDEEVAKAAAGNAYMGARLPFVVGDALTLSTLQTFFAAMASNPHIQKRAQDALDTMVGPDRLPTLEDKPDLPYITAIVKECLRWRSVVPLSVPHVAVQEDQYEGYCIPAGSVVIANTWAYSRHTKYYPDPETFKPERFLLESGELNPDVLDPAEMAFGYGRRPTWPNAPCRICPGRYFAEASLFTVIASVLHTFDISAPLDEDGIPVKLDVRMTNGVVSYPEPFECIIRSRSAAAEALVRASAPA
ncbi:CyP450 monooxygenase [Cerioporus squamosus]|nr:CyP450 monooxygenase [Cerioporus squamosus]